MNAPVAIKREIITPSSEEHWLSLREPNLNSTDIAALFGCSPYLTAFELWHRKAGSLTSDFKDNERMAWGRRLEAVVAAGIGEDNDWLVVPFKDYVHIPAYRIGSSFDFAAAVPASVTGGPNAILEIKCVDYFAYKDGWIIDGDTVEAPPHIELQVQHQMLVSGIDRAYIGVLIGGNHVVVLERQADPQIHRLIVAKAAAFWKSIEDGMPPKPDYSTDARAIIALNSNVRDGAFIDATDDAEIAQAITEYHHVSSEVSALEKLKEEKKARLLELVGDAEKVVAGRFTVSTGMVKESSGTLVTEDMVGTYIGSRKAYRMCRVNVKKEKQ